MTPTVHTTGINWTSILTLTTLSGGLLAGFVAFLSRSLREARRYISKQARDVTDQLAEQVVKLDRRTTRMTWAGLAGLVITSALAIADITGDRRHHRR